ncbi:hypothetical protein H0H92_003370 [Tricholoma furcatifolium]|nr:hypothetical protein H0H92_003370 [Tricholoma furcatifolium]
MALDFPQISGDSPSTTRPVLHQNYKINESQSDAAQRVNNANTCFETHKKSFYVPPYGVIGSGRAKQDPPYGVIGDYRGKMMAQTSNWHETVIHPRQTSEPTVYDFIPAQVEAHLHQGGDYIDLVKPTWNVAHNLTISEENADSNSEDQWMSSHYRSVQDFYIVMMDGLLYPQPFSSPSCSFEDIYAGPGFIWSQLPKELPSQPISSPSCFFEQIYAGPGSIWSRLPKGLPSHSRHFA